MRELEIAHAEWVLDRLAPERVPELASGLIEAGYDEPVLAALAGARDPTWREIEGAWLELLRVMGRPKLTLQEGAVLVAREFCRRALDGGMSEREAAHEIASIWSDAGQPDELTAFVALDDEYDDRPRGESKIDAEFRDHARKFLEEKGTTAA